MIPPCNSKCFWVVDSVHLRLCVGKDQGGNPDPLLLRVGQSVHVDVALHVVQLQSEVVPRHIQVELVPKDLSDLVDIQDFDQVNCDVDLHLDEEALLSDGEGSVVRSIVGRLNDQRATVFVREVFAVWKLVAPFLHRDASAVVEAGELLQGADGHEGGKGFQGVGEADVFVKLPSLGSGAHICDRSHAGSIHGIVNGGELPRLYVFIVLDDTVEESLVVRQVVGSVPSQSVEHVHQVVLAQTSKGCTRWKVKIAHAALEFLLTAAIVVSLDS